MKLLPLLALAFATASFGAEPEYPKMGPDIYDPTADGDAQIVMALTQAKAEQKHVLLMFGANWCIWCRRLHHTFQIQPAIAKCLDENYVLVLVDVNMRHGIKRNYDINERYGNPIKEGLPVFVVLDGKGHQLTTQESGALEDGKDGHDPVKVLAFLRQWAPKK